MKRNSSNRSFTSDTSNKTNDSISSAEQQTLKKLKIYRANKLLGLNNPNNGQSPIINNVNTNNGNLSKKEFNVIQLFKIFILKMFLPFQALFQQFKIIVYHLIVLIVMSVKAVIELIFLLIQGILYVTITVLQYKQTKYPSKVDYKDPYNRNTSNKNYLQLLRKQSFNNLFKDQQQKIEELTLVIEIDGFLVHIEQKKNYKKKGSSNKNLNQLEYSANNKLEKSFEVNTRDSQGKIITFIVQKRDYLERFFQEVSELYTLVLFTHLPQDLAQQILYNIDPQGIFKLKFFRDNCHYHPKGQIKDIRQVRESTKRVVVIDTNQFGMQWNKENGIVVQQWNPQLLDDQFNLLNMIDNLKSIALKSQDFDDITEILEDYRMNQENEGYAYYSENSEDEKILSELQ